MLKLLPVLVELAVPRPHSSAFFTPPDARKAVKCSLGTRLCPVTFKLHVFSLTISHKLTTLCRCDKGARYVDMGGDPAKASAFFCSEKCWVSKWGKKHDRELLYRLGNSPRTGACGYPADTPHPDFR